MHVTCAAGHPSQQAWLAYTCHALRFRITYDLPAGPVHPPRLHVKARAYLSSLFSPAAALPARPVSR